jgi:hypothetical protein
LKGDAGLKISHRVDIWDEVDCSCSREEEEEAMHFV